MNGSLSPLGATLLIVTPYWEANSNKTRPSLFSITTALLCLCISAKVDGSEDKIHHLKAGEIAASAIQAIVEPTCQLLEEDGIDGDYPFAF